MAKVKNRQTYKYIKANSILAGQTDEYALSIREYYMIYTFYVTYSCCGTQSMKKRTFADYGWNNFARTIGNSTIDANVYLKDALTAIIDLDDIKSFVFTTDGDDLAQCYTSLNLGDGVLNDIDSERAVCSKNNESSRYLNLFYRIRDGFAHGKFLLKYGTNNAKMVVIQDDDVHNVTARIVLKLETLLRMIEIIDRNNLIQR